MASKLVSVKFDPKAREEKAETLVADRPLYPWGLSLNLDTETLEKLGLTTLPGVDTEMMLVAAVTVTSVSSNESTGGKENRSVSLQITEMCLEKGSKAKSLYAEQDGEK